MKTKKHDSEVENLAGRIEHILAGKSHSIVNDALSVVLADRILLDYVESNPGDPECQMAVYGVVRSVIDAIVEEALNPRPRREAAKVLKAG